MKRAALPTLILSLTALSACSLFGGLTEEEEKAVDQHKRGAALYFNARQYEKAIDQAQRGLRIQPEDYDLLNRLGWAYVELAAQRKTNNHEHLRRAETIFGKIIHWRDDQDHDPRTIYGYGKVLYMRARVEADVAEQLRQEAKKPDGDKSLTARAAEHDKKARALDRQSKHYFLKLAEGDLAQRRNRRDAYKFLMILAYRQNDLKGAIAYGEKNLELNAKEVAFREKQYGTTHYSEHERVIRNELAQLKSAEVTIRSRLAAYHRELSEWSAAITHLDEILKARPNSFQDYYLRGTCYRALEDHAAAAKDFRKFLQLGNLSEEHVAVKDASRYLSGRGK